MKKNEISFDSFIIVESENKKLNLPNINSAKLKSKSDNPNTKKIRNKILEENDNNINDSDKINSNEKNKAENKEDEK